MYKKLFISENRSSNIAKQELAMLGSTSTSQSPSRTAPYSKPIRLSKEEEAHIPDSSKSNGIVRSPEKSPPRPLSVRRSMKRERKGRFTSGFIPLSVLSTHPLVDNCAQLADCAMKDPKLSLRTLVVMKKLPEKSRTELQYKPGQHSLLNKGCFSLK